MNSQKGIYKLDLTKKPSEPYKKVITPSSLYKARCPRCTWLSYWHNFSLPVNLVLNQQLSRLQEAFFDGKETHFFAPEVKKGKVNLFKGKRTSKPIKVNGEDTRWAFHGELDFVIEYTDGRIGIADGKVSLKKDAEALVENYWSQLHSYAYMLEHPNEGDRLEIDSLGLIQWRIDNTLPQESDLRGFSVEHRYVPVDRTDEKFTKFMENFVLCIEGEFPEPSGECAECKWLSEIGFQY